MKSSFQFAAAVLTVLVLGHTIDLAAQTFKLGRQTFSSGKTEASSPEFQSSGVVGETVPDLGESENFITTTEFIPEANVSCCLGRVGDANGLGGDEPTIGDISVMIDAKFITGTCVGILDCPDEADINQSGGTDATCDDVTIGDISTLIDYLFITGPSLGLPDCL